MPFKSFKDMTESREKTKWGDDLEPGENPTIEQLKVGFLQRIAEAVELLAKPQLSAKKMEDHLHASIDKLWEDIEEKDKKIRALRREIRKAKETKK